MVDMKQLGDSIVEIVKTFVAQQIGLVSKRIDVLHDRFDGLRMPKDGVDGKDGIDGKSVEPAEVEGLVLRAVAALPPAKDGTSITVEDVAPLIADQVKAAASQIPIPVNGKDADPEAIAELVRAEVAKIPVPADGKSVSIDDVAPLIAAEVSKAVATIPLPKDGKDAEPLDQAAIIREVLAAVPPPKDGSSVTVADVAPLIEQQVKAAVEAIPRAADGKDAEPLDHSAVVKDVLAAIRVPIDGKSVTPEDVQPMLSDLVAKAVGTLPKPKDGENVPVDQVQKMIDEAVSKAMASVQMPKDGEHGRDALDIEILPAINEGRRYARGTYASHNGGVWVSRRSTEGMDGWECIHEGDKDDEIELADDMRTFTFRKIKSSGRVIEKSFKLPVVLYRGIFKAEEQYEIGDATTWDGSMWIAQRSTQEKPGTSDAWRLSAKRGRDGRDGLKGEKGERGAQGRDGKDLTQRGDGQKW